MTNNVEPTDINANNDEDQAAKPTDDGEQFRKLFVGGLSQNTSNDGLRDFYSQFGLVTDSIVVHDQITKKSRGFGFVTFSTKEEVDKAMENRPHTIDQKTIDPKRAVPRDQSIRGESNVSTARLYMTGIREEHSEESIQEYFKQFGNVTKVEIVLDKQTSKPRGFGFVTFNDYDAVDKCVLMRTHHIDGHRCEVKKALNRDEMARAQQMDKDRAERGLRLRNARNGTGWPNSQRSSSIGAGGWREPHGGTWNRSADTSGQWYGQAHNTGSWAAEPSGYAQNYGQGYVSNSAPYTGGAYTGGWTSDSWNSQQSGWSSRNPDPRNLTSLGPESGGNYSSYGHQ